LYGGTNIGALALGGILLRVFIACSDSSLSEALRAAFEVEGDFEICGAAKNRVEAITKGTELSPNLIILERELTPRDGFEAAEELKLIMPEVPLFLVSSERGPRAEKDAFSHGIDAVFEKDHDFTSLIMNARAVCNPE
jgi:two-component system, NarL family, response regulator DesR